MFSPFKWIRRIIGGLILALIAAVVFSGFYLFNSAKQMDITKTDAIVVLGAAQYNGKPTEVLQNRLDHAYDIYKLQIAKYIITVGGKQPGDKFTEAEAGRKYLIKKGVPAKRIIAIPTGSNTIESMQAVAAEIHKRKWVGVTVSTDPVHIARVIVIANKLGIKAFPFPTLTGPGTELGVSRVVGELGAIIWFVVWEQWSI